MEMIHHYLEMNHTWLDSSSFAKREIATRASAPSLIIVVASETLSTIVQLPAEMIAKAQIIIGKKIFHCFKKAPATWEKHWKPIETAKKVVFLLIALLSTVLIGWMLPRLNYKVFEQLGLAKKIESPERPLTILQQGPNNISFPELVLDEEKVPEIQPPVPLVESPDLESTSYT